MKWHGAQMTERRIAGPEIIKFESDTQLAQARQDVTGVLDIGHYGTFRQFQPKGAVDDA